MNTKNTVDTCQPDERRERTIARVNLVHAYNTLIDTLGRLGASGSEEASMLWDMLPNAAPVGAPTTLRRAWLVSQNVRVINDAMPEWLAYAAALEEFRRTPLFGPAPMPCPPGALAALDNGEVWLFKKGGG